MGYVPYRKSIHNFAIAGALIAFSSFTLIAQQQNQDTEDHVTKVHGTVVNSITGAPVARALVTLLGNQYAMMTNDQGSFEFDFHQQFQKGLQSGISGNGVFVHAQKQGFLPSGRMATIPSTSDSAGQGQPEPVKLLLVPESLIVGHIDVPGSEGNIRIQCGLLERDFVNGHVQWMPVRTFMTWASGEFRFSELKAGIYKLITYEQMDSTTLQAGPGVQLYGYPPMYFTNTTNFSDASEIVLKPGETARLNMSVRRKAYYPVHLPVRNVPENSQVNVRVWPMGSHGPGWSLGFVPGTRAVEGILPSGNYTVELDARGETGAAGILNFAVKDGPVDGPTLTMAPSAMVTVNIHVEFANYPIGMGNENPADSSSQRPRHVSGVELIAIDEVGGNTRLDAEPVDGSDWNTWVFKNVPPARYRVQVGAFNSYVASIDSEGTDLLHRNLVVGLGASVPPLEATLRDDGGEVDAIPEVKNGSGSANAQADSNAGNSPGSPVFVVLLPLDESNGSLNQGAGNGTIHMKQVSPGDYLALAFEQNVPQDLPYGNREAMREWINEGKVLHVEAGQQISVHLRLLQGVPN